MRFVVLAGVLLLAACEAPPVPSPSAAQSSPDTVASGGTVWAVDLVKTHPGAQAQYLRFLDLNWTPARAAAKADGVVTAYRILVAVTDSASAWDVMLMTEYADSARFADREVYFQALFEQPEHQMKPVDGKGPRDLADIVSSHTLTAPPEMP